MTEFTLFLPIWIFVFIGILNLGRVGIFSTKVQLKAQKDLWNQVIQLTEGFEVDEHMTPISGGGFALAEYGSVAGLGGNDQPVLDGVEAAAGGAMILGGHYVESFEKSHIPLGPFIPSDHRNKPLPTDVLDESDTSRYSHKLLNDTIVEANYSAGSVGDIVSALLAASGFVHAVGAGIRYGSVFSNHSETETFLSDFGTFTAGAHYDVLVAPRALTGAEAFTVPFGVAFVQFKTDEKYMEYLMFGDENWGGNFGAADTPEDGEWDDEVDSETEDDIEEQCDAICSSYDPDAENPGPEPDGYSECGC